MWFKTLCCCVESGGSCHFEICITSAVLYQVSYWAILMAAYLRWALSSWKQLARLWSPAVPSPNLYLDKLRIWHQEYPVNKRCLQCLSHHLLYDPQLSFQESRLEGEWHIPGCPVAINISNRKTDKVCQKFTPTPPWPCDVQLSHSLQALLTLDPHVMVERLRSNENGSTMMMARDEKKLMMGNYWYSIQSLIRNDDVCVFLNLKMTCFCLIKNLFQQWYIKLISDIYDVTKYFDFN